MNDLDKIQDQLDELNKQLAYLKKNGISGSQGGTGTEKDPTVPSHVKSITKENIASWNNKQEKLSPGENITIEGNSISSYQPETDPTVPSHVKSISTENIQSWNGKQDKLTAGENITISNNIISSAGITAETDPTVPSHVKNISEESIDSWNNKQDKLTAGDGIKIDGNVISSTGSSSGGEGSGGESSGGEWETVYDKDSPDPNINLGKTTGLLAASLSPGIKDLSPYNKIRIFWECNSNQHIIKEFDIDWSLTRQIFMIFSFSTNCNQAIVQNTSIYLDSTTKKRLFSVNTGKITLLASSGITTESLSSNKGYFIYRVDVKV